MKRSQISKRLRFAIFTRDSFTCRYCGRSAPEVTLEVDHVQAVSRGGNNDPSNLATACYDCNRGKTDSVLCHQSLPSGFMDRAADLVDHALADRNSWTMGFLAQYCGFPIRVVQSIIDQLTISGEVRHLPDGRFYATNPSSDHFAETYLDHPSMELPEWLLPKYVKPIPWSRERVEIETAGLSPSARRYTMDSDECARIAEAF